MTKKFVLLLVAMVGMTLHSRAQESKLPPIKKFVKVTATGVNFRQKPTTASKKLGWFLDEGMSVGWFGNNEPFLEYNRVNETVLPVTGESGDWYQVYLSFTWEDELDKMFSSETAYIMKKFCVDVSQKPLSLPAPEKEIVMITSGIYKNYCFFLDGHGGDHDCLRIGKYDNGMFVFDRYINVWGNVGKYYQESGSHFQKDVNYNFTRFIFDDSVADEWHKLQLDKLIKTPSVLNYLMGNLSKAKPFLVAFYGVVGDSDWHLLTSD